MFPEASQLMPGPKSYILRLISALIDQEKTEKKSINKPYAELDKNRLMFSLAIGTTFSTMAKTYSFEINFS
jgi:hypothetical protein